MSSRVLPALGSKKLESESKKSQKVEISTLFQPLGNFFINSDFDFLGRKAPGTHFQLRFVLSARRPKNCSGAIEGSQH